MNPDLEEWNKSANLWLSRISNNDTPRIILLRQGIEEAVPNIVGKKILDVGCGDGWACQFLNKKGGLAIGVDGSEVLIKQAQKKYPEIDFRQSDLLLPIEFKDETFDVVLANMLLNSLSDINVFLKESHRILKTKGILLISVLHPCLNFPTLNLYKSLVDKILRRKPSGLVKNYFQRTASRKEDQTGTVLPFYHRTLAEYSTFLKNAGFVIEQIFEPHLLPEEFLAKNAQYEYFTRIARFLFIKAVKI